jgi:inositol phosphorylceramide mannosyltransferase catalytic subunit
MNRRVIVAFLVLFIPIVYILWISSSLLALILEDGLRDSVDLAAIEKNANQSSVTHPIPKILHQTWKNNDIPEQWQIAQFTWYVLKPFSWRSANLFVA